MEQQVITTKGNHRVIKFLDLYYVQHFDKYWKPCVDWRKKTLHFVKKEDAISKMEELSEKE